MKTIRSIPKQESSLYKEPIMSPDQLRTTIEVSYNN